MTKIIDSVGAGTALNQVQHDGNWDSICGINESQTGTTHTIDVNDQNRIIEYSNASPIAVTLPAISSVTGANLNTSDFRVILKNIGAGTVTVTRGSTDTFDDGTTSKTLTQYQCIEIQTDSTLGKWNILSFYQYIAPATANNLAMINSEGEIVDSLVETDGSGNITANVTGNVTGNITTTSLTLNGASTTAVTGAELEYLAGVTLGTSSASKVVTANASNHVGINTAPSRILHTASAVNGLSIPLFDGKANTATTFATFSRTDNSQICTLSYSGSALTAGGATFDVTATNWRRNGTTIDATAAELNYNDITTLGTVQSSKTVTADASGNINFNTASTQKQIKWNEGIEESGIFGDTIGDLGAFDYTNTRIIWNYDVSDAELDLGSAGVGVDIVGTFQIGGTTVSATATKLNYNDITTLGTIQASKTVTADASGIVKYDTSSSTGQLRWDTGAKVSTLYGDTGVNAGNVVLADTTNTRNIWKYDESANDLSLGNTAGTVTVAGNLEGYHRGALVYRTTNQAITTATNTKINFTAEDYDTDTIHDNATNNTRLTVPTGATKVRLTGQVYWESFSATTITVELFKNNAVTFNGYTRDQTGNTATRRALSINSPIFSVTGGDYFELNVYQDSGSNKNVSPGLGGETTWFAMEVIE